MAKQLESSASSQPSTAFHGQHRGRAESEPQRAHRRAMLWLFPAAASLVVLGMVIMRAATLLPEPSPAGQARPPASAPPNPVARERQRRVEAPARASARTPSRLAPRLQPPPSPPSAEPEVLVPSGERPAFEQFLAGRSRWRLHSAPPPSEGLAPLAVERLAIAPLEVRPLAIED
jgi:hypothetical protein